ncbi:MAG: hypothetical protein GDA36_10735 [Rhodobacteraceae bacterium]|nr:hypothetical protein [Paracoccaceae bacterium]
MPINAKLVWKAPPRPGSHSSADTQARWVRKGPKRMPGYKMTSNGFARPDEESFIDKVHAGTCEPGREPRVRYHG